MDLPPSAKLLTRSTQLPPKVVNLTESEAVRLFGSLLCKLTEYRASYGHSGARDSRCVTNIGYSVSEGTVERLCSMRMDVIDSLSLEFRQ